MKAVIKLDKKCYSEACLVMQAILLFYLLSIFGYINITVVGLDSIGQLIFKSIVKAYNKPNGLPCFKVSVRANVNSFY